MSTTVEEKLKLSNPKRPRDECVAAATAGRFAGEAGNYAPPSVENPSPYQAQAPPAEDLLWGARAIASFLGWTIDRVYYQVRKNADKKTPENEKLPIAKLGPKTMVSSRKKLQRAINDTLTQ